MGVLARQPARADMFRVAANMNETYYGEDVQQRKSNLDAPRVTVNNHRMTRRATRPFVPQADPAYNDLQRQVQLLETLPAAPIRPTRVNIDDLLSTDSLPAPAKRGDAPKKEEAAPAPAAPKQRQVGIADQIAIRSYVLGKGLAKSSMAE